MKKRFIAQVISGTILLLGFLTVKPSFGQPILPDGTNSDDGSGTNGSYYPTDPPLVITYPTNAVLKWALNMSYGTPLVSSLSLAPDGTLYSVNQEYLSAINTSVVDTNDPSYPSQNDFTKWVANRGYWYGSGTTPAIGVDGTIYSSTDGITFSAIDPANGTNLWDFTATTTASVFGGAQPAIGADGTVYISGDAFVPSINPSSEISLFYALTNAFGTTNYYSNTNLYSNPLVGLGIKWIFVITNGGQLFSGAAPAIGRDGTIYVNELNSIVELNNTDTFGTGLFALNPTNGILLWQTSPLNSLPLSQQTMTGRGATGAAIGPDGTVYYGMGTNFVAINPNAPVTNGVMGFKWIYSNPAISFAWRPVVGSDGTIYVEANTSTISYGSYPASIIETNWLFAFDPTTGTPKWTASLSSTNYYGVNWKIGSLAIAADGEIILADADGTLYSFAPSGQTNWTYQTGPQALGSPLIGPDGTIYVESIDGDGITCYVYALAGVSPIACASWPEDGRNARRTATVVNASLSSPMMTPNSFQVTITGPTNMPVCLGATEDFVVWTNLGQTILAGGSTNFVDTNVIGYRFYRAFPQ